MIKSSKFIRLTLFIFQIIKYTLPLKLITSDLFTYNKLNQ
jgi:hypothetical protein